MFFSDEINKNNKMDLEDIRNFLKNFEVAYDFPDKTFVVRKEGNIISTGSVDGNVLKYFFTSPEYKGEGTISIIYNSLLTYILESGHSSYFVFTLPENKEIFQSLGLNIVYNTDRVALLEGGFYNYSKWIEKTKKSLSPKNGKRGAIVMNCNPMTLGHKYLIESAMEEVDNLIIFLVEEDKSEFKFADRWSILREELAKEKRIDIIGSGPYIISRATFPTYFLKKKDDNLDTYTKLDAGIFAEKIAKDLEIDIRFLGSEPFDRVTEIYNKNIKEIFDKHNIVLEILDRKEIDGNIVSASKVRKLLKEAKEIQAYKYLPQATINFLEAEKGKKTLERMRK